MAVWAIYHGLDCHRCTQQLKEVRGCHGMQETTFIDGFEVTQCPMRSLGPAEAMRIEAYRQYVNGYLPNAGGWLNQPGKLMSAIGIIADLKTKYSKEQGNE